MSSANTPLYFIPATDPAIAYWKPLFEQFARADTHTLSFSINPETVDTLDVARIQQLTFALQHYPAILEKFVFAIEFQFREIADSQLYYQEPHWKSEPKYYQWFFTMASQPHLLFFIQDHDARFYFLIGDWLSSGKVTGKDTGGKLQPVSLNAEQVQQMAQRVFNCCRMFNLYCHGTGVDAQPYIESLIAEYNFDESNMYQMLGEQYEEDIKNGIKLSMVPLKNHPK